jgi:hypothetical protein
MARAWHPPVQLGELAKVPRSLAVHRAAAVPTATLSGDGRLVS